MRKLAIFGLFVILLFIAACGSQPATPPVNNPPVQANPTCVDGIQNQGELTIDCGGPCPPCPSCIDGIRNQDETNIDCGGPCQACASCSDGIRNQDETNVDCGGVCNPCAVPPKTVSYEVSAEDKAIIQDKQATMTQAMFAKTTAMNMKPGDSFVFALGVKNLKVYSSKFRVNVVFVEARDTSNNPLATNDKNFDDSYINQWFGKSDFTKEYSLEPNAAAVMPIIVTVGDMYTAGKPTAKGSYTFRADIEFWDEYDFWNEYSSKLFTVNIA